MSICIARIAVLAALSLAGVAGAAFSQTAPSVPPTPRPAAAPPPSAVPVVMTMGDLMNTLVQPRHLKLGLAGQAQNWPLARYALEQLRAAFANIVSAKPKFAGMPVGDLVDLALTPAAQRCRGRHQAAGPTKIRRRLRSADPGLQRLPHGARSPLCRDQAGRCLGVSEPGFQPAALGLCARLRRRGGLDAYQGRAPPAALRQIGQKRRAIETIGPLVGCGSDVDNGRQTDRMRARSRTEWRTACRIRSTKFPPSGPSAPSSRRPNTRKCTQARWPIPTAFGPSRPSASTGRSISARSRTPRSPKTTSRSNGSRTAPPTSPTTASTATCTRAATRPPSSGKATIRKIQSTSPISNCTTRSAASPISCATATSRRATASPSICR